jgi:hypothetical protein
MSGPEKKSRSSGSNMQTLLHELESSDDEESPNNATPAWLTEFNMYINTTDEIPKEQTIVQWWGVS